MVRNALSVIPIRIPARPARLGRVHRLRGGEAQ